MSSIKARVVNKQDNSAAILRKYNLQVKQIVNKGVQDTRNTAVKSIHETSGGGVTYQKYKPKRTHTASKAGDPPNTDTGYLANNIFGVVDSDGFGGSVESRADYSHALEFGTSKMDARPFLQPALEENKKNIKRMFNRLNAGGRR